jgi:hypothetical protein
MLAGKRGAFEIGEESRLHVSKPIFYYFLLGIIFLVLIYLVSSDLDYEKKFYNSSSILKDRRIFSYLDKLDEIKHTIKLRESLNKGDIHRVFFQVEVAGDIHRERLSSLAQRIVKETIAQEDCHSIRIDFGPHGYVDFAPFGDWDKAGEIPLGVYRNYRFKYIFSSSLPSK